MSKEILNTSNVSISTATIEVKVMKIGNRQVTLSVFRQLPEKPIIHPETGELQGTPWGRVNYHIDCEDMHVTHHHIVWQQEDKLYRSIAFLPWETQYQLMLPSNFYSREMGRYQHRHYSRGERSLSLLPVAQEMIQIWLDPDDNLDRLQELYRRMEGWNAEIDATRGYLLNHMNTVITWQQSYSQLEQLDQLFIAV